jgi:hypothetical protein
MHRLRTLPVVVLLCATALAGCTDESPKKAASTPSSTSSGSASSSATPSDSTASVTPTSPPPSASEAPQKFPRDRIEAANMHLAYLDTSVAKSRQEKAVVDAWMAFWQGAADTYYLYKPTDQFLSVARGQAKTDILDYMNDLKAQKHRVVGWSKDNVTKVTIDDDTATVEDCTENFTYTVDSEIEPLTRPDPYYLVTGTFKKDDGRWTVVAQTSKSLNKSCLS